MAPIFFKSIIREDNNHLIDGALPHLFSDSDTDGDDVADGTSTQHTVEVNPTVLELWEKIAQHTNGRRGYIWTSKRAFPSRAGPDRRRIIRRTGRVPARPGDHIVPRSRFTPSAASFRSVHGIHWSNIFVNARKI